MWAVPPYADGDVRVIVCGPDDLLARMTALTMIRTWHGEPEVVPGPELKGVDFVVALPGGMGERIVERARQAGVRIIEVVDANPHPGNEPRPAAR